MDNEKFEKVQEIVNQIKNIKGYRSFNVSIDSSFCIDEFNIKFQLEK